MSAGGYWPGDPASTESAAADVDRAEPSLGGGEQAAPATAPRVEPPVPTNGAEPAPEAAAAAETDGLEAADAVVAPDRVAEPDEAGAPAAEAVAEPAPAPHAPGELVVPDDVAVFEGLPDGADRTVGVVVSRFNGEITNRLLESALAELDRAGVARDRITVMPVPGAFELPFAAMALAKTRRFSCIVALGCVIRGETSHFEYVAAESASGLQLAGLETGVPVAYGVLTVDTPEQAVARAGRGADAVRSALEMADLFQQVRSSRS